MKPRELTILLIGAMIGSAICALGAKKELKRIDEDLHKMKKFQNAAESAFGITKTFQK